MGTFTEPDSRVLGSESIDIPMLDDGRKVVCRVCGHYILSWNLVSHLRKQHGLRPFYGQNVAEFRESISEHKERIRREFGSRGQKTRKELKARLYEVYGSKCECCGETNPKFLTLDHVRNDGGTERRIGMKNNSIMLKAIREKDKSHYQILCYNCNMGKARNGGICPHKQDLSFQFKRTGEIIANYIIDTKKKSDPPIPPLPPKDKYDQSCR